MVSQRPFQLPAVMTSQDGASQATSTPSRLAISVATSMSKPSYSPVCSFSEDCGGYAGSVETVSVPFSQISASRSVTSPSQTPPRRSLRPARQSSPCRRPRCRRRLRHRQRGRGRAEPPGRRSGTKRVRMRGLCTSRRAASSTSRRVQSDAEPGHAGSSSSEALAPPARRRSVVLPSTDQVARPDRCTEANDAPVSEPTSADGLAVQPEAEAVAVAVVVGAADAAHLRPGLRASRSGPRRAPATASAGRRPW